MKTLAEQKAVVLDKLLGGGVDIEFIKADGSLRIMNAALSADDEVNGFGKNEATATVFDTGISAYRKFAWSGLSKVDGETFTHSN
ncbi:MAG: hypothetical protein COA84_12970 [Robiginitomaculum sp.]|nr:MAG: hypothetical protein COA84_12970 [Robiginitomaculum sp.]